MGLLSSLGLQPSKARAKGKAVAEDKANAKGKADATAKAPDKAKPPDKAKADKAKPSSSAKAAPTAQQVAERDRITHALKEVVPQVKALATGRDQRAGEAVKLAQEAGGLLSWQTLDKAKEKLAALMSLLGGKAGVPEDSPRRAPQSNAEVSLEEFDKDLGGAIGNIGKMRKAAKAMGADQLDEHMGKLSDGLSAVKDKAGKLVEIAELARDIQEFQRALATARSLDLNRDYEAAAVAMGDLANIGGKLAKKASGNGVPGLDAYFTLLQNAGAVWEMGARVRKRREAEADAAADSERDGAAEKAPSEPKVNKAGSAEIPLGDVPAFMQGNMKTARDETKWKGGKYINDMPDWELSTDAFLKAFDEFKPMVDKREEITLGRLSAEYRSLGKQMQAPYAEAMRHLQHLQQALAKCDDLSLNYEPALKAMKKAAP